MDKVFLGELGRKNRRIKINGKYLNNLRFADDVALFAEDSKVLQDMVLEFEMASKKVGLKINIEKTMLLSGQPGGANILLRGEVIKLEEETTYIWS